MRTLAVLGAGGHGKVVAECALAGGRYDSILFFDDRLSGETVLGFAVAGGLADAGSCDKDSTDAFVAIGNNEFRVTTIRWLTETGFHVPVLIHPFTSVSASAAVGMGSCVLAGAVISAKAEIGVGAIINTCASVDHDCRLGQGVHVSPGARLAGAVTVGDFSWICIGASIANNIRIGQNSIVAAGAAVICDVDSGVLVAGVPSKEKSRFNRVIT